MMVKFQSKNVFFEERGEGDALVLLHGFTESGLIWNFFAKVLSESFRVIVIDLPGHGKSHSLSQVHKMELMGNMVRFVLDHLEVSKAVIIGHSMGGYVALSFAKMFPELVNGLGLFHSSASADSEEARKNREVAIKAVEKNHKGFLFNFIPDLFALENRKKFSKEIDELVSRANQIDKNGIIAALKGMKIREEMHDVLKNADFPVMFIAGKQDSRIPLNLLTNQMSLPSEGYSLILEKVGHMGYIEAPKETLEFVTFFAKRCFSQ